MNLDTPATNDTQTPRARINIRCSQLVRDRFDELGGSKWFLDLMEGANFTEAEIAQMVAQAIEGSISKSMAKQAADFPDRLHEALGVRLGPGDVLYNEKPFDYLRSEERRQEILAESEMFLKGVDDEIILAPRSGGMSASGEIAWMSSKVVAGEKLRDLRRRDTIIFLKGALGGVLIGLAIWIAIIWATR